ncbi:CsbA family protein [Solibacillus sp. FSL H8-0538]|uniref:CsbA family protein n=1 Tax=Solibacillus sp. FSL H8-0538 TaxID=2921400 RepID=UPI0030F7DC5F
MEDLSVKIMMALFIPGLLVVLFMRITFNHYVALVLAIALITASVYAGYTTPSIIFVVDAFSLTVGFWFARTVMSKGKE